MHSKMESSSVCCTAPNDKSVIILFVLLYEGRITGKINLTSSNLTYAGTGTFTYIYSVKAMERLNFTASLDGAAVGSGVTVNITSLLPTAVDVNRSLSAAAVQRDGSSGRITWGSSPTALLAHSWHLLYVPVYAAGRSTAMFPDPKLGARLVASASVTAAPPVSNSSSNASAVTMPYQVFTFGGYWSSSNGSYVIPFKLPVLGDVSGVVQLLGNASSNTTLVRRLFFSGCTLLFTDAPRAPQAILTLFAKAGCVLFWGSAGLQECHLFSFAAVRIGCPVHRQHNPRLPSLCRGCAVHCGQLAVKH